MSWDLKQDLATGDLVWDAKRDLAYSDGADLLQQRIHRRLIIERGEYLYDRAGTIGSRLRSLLHMGVPVASGGLEMIIREALEPMDDIRITNIQVFTYGDGFNVVNSPSNVLARISYEINFSNVEAPSGTTGQFTTDVAIPL